MKTNLPNRAVRFFIEDGCLVRTVSGGGGGGTFGAPGNSGASGASGPSGGYTHRCAKPVFETVAWVIEELPRAGDGTTLRQIAWKEALPFTQVNVALEFLKERGIVAVRHRRCYPATTSVHLDALIEFHALAEEKKPA